MMVNDTRVVVSVGRTRPRNRFGASRRARPLVRFEFILDDVAGTPMSYLLVLKYVAAADRRNTPRVRELRFLANGQLLWAIDVQDAEVARELLFADMARQA